MERGSTPRPAPPPTHPMALYVTTLAVVGDGARARTPAARHRPALTCRSARRHGGMPHEGDDGSGNSGGNGGAGPPPCRDSRGGADGRALPSFSALRCLPLGRQGPPHCPATRVILSPVCFNRVLFLVSYRRRPIIRDAHPVGGGRGRGGGGVYAAGSPMPPPTTYPPPRHVGSRRNEHRDVSVTASLQSRAARVACGGGGRGSSGDVPPRVPRRTRAREAGGGRGGMHKSARPPPSPSVR